MKLVRAALAVAAACFASLSAAQYALEIIPLKHRTVEQVLDYSPSRWLLERLMGVG